MQIVADLEVHSKYSRAVSSSMVLESISLWSEKKGINLVGSGDFTHPLWLKEIETKLEEDAQGIYKLKRGSAKTRFLLTTEVSCVYSHKGKLRRVHTMIFLPDINSVRKFNKELSARGANLFSDGRPIVGFSLSQVLEMALNSSEKALVIPAHVWTPWFGLYGSMSGYTSIKEAFGDLEKFVPAIETGLSSDPAMNWKIGELEEKEIVSFGDAHSPQKLGREATVFELTELSFDALSKAICKKGDDDRIVYTIEFYPEEGKYHYTGHRNCGVSYSPNEAKKKGFICPVCGKQLTIGVMSRVESLSTKSIEIFSENDDFGVRWIKPKNSKRPGYVMLVPLLELLVQGLNKGVGSREVASFYDLLVEKFGSELDVLLRTKIEDIENFAGKKISEAVKKVRLGEIVIKPGYDGIFGEIKIWDKEMGFKQNSTQETLF